ncbi:hypothetical protein GCM10009736_04510 [Actinomadura bangladeshensis]
MLQVGAAAVKVVRASRRSFDRIDDLMSAFRPLSPRSENRPRTGRTKAGVFPTPFPETRLTGFTQVPHAYAQHVDNSVDNS